VRPLTLKLDGLRSYRREVEVDFSGVSLLAIVGDTGAGKSSLLEAITYALYGSSTWSGQPGDLIADNARTMRVELVFSVDGRRWKATRSMSRDGYPPPVHRLECLDEPAHRIDGRSSVNVTIERLIGLDHKAFLRSVILPQGRFAELLQDTGANRTGILRNIFRVDDLERCRESAQQLLFRLQPALEGLRKERSLLLPDPAATAADAAERAQAARRHLDELDQLQQRLVELEQEAADAERSSQDARRLADGLTEPRFTGIAEVLRGLAEIAGELARQRGALDEKRGRVADELQANEARLREAENAGEGLADLTQAASTLERLAEELPGFAEEFDTRTQQQTELESEAEQLREIEQQARQLEEQAAAAEAEGRRRHRLATDAHEAVRTARTNLVVAREAQAALRKVEKEVASQDRALATLAKAQKEAERASGEADAALRATRVELDALRRAQAAAHAAHGLHPGDPCPVCQRELPAQFAPPEAPSLVAAEQSALEAEETANRARTLAARVQAEVDGAREHLDELRSRYEEDLAAAGDALAAARASLGVPATDLTPDALGRPDQELLAGLLAAVNEADRQAEQADAEAAALRQRATQAATEAKERGLNLERRKREQEGLLERLRRRLSGAVSRAAMLPAAYRPSLPTADQLLTGAVGPAAALDPGRLAPLRQALNAKVTELKAAADARDELAAHRQCLTDDIAALDDQFRQDVDVPAGEARMRLAAIGERAVQAAEHLGVQAPPPAPGADDLVTLSRWASGLEVMATSLAEQARRSAETAAKRIRVTREQAAEALITAGLPDAAAVDGARLEAAGNARDAQRDLDEASAQVPQVADLDRRLAEGGAFLAAIEAVKNLLTDGQFIGHVIHQRQQALLGVASQTLGEITGQRFGFAADFRVVDRLTAQPRSPRTLSGGESFLASLALALGMVELAGRAGGRLDALFLDEGFGALDNVSLDAALDALEARAASGRLVAVISHVRSITERIEDVLAIRVTPAGSEAHWLTRSERIQEITHELTESVASGLLR
jgi:DNA repair protein SbcC/Rad50